MKKMILHLGADKTGTSALQSFFSNNVEQLKINGFSYYKTKNIDLAKNYATTSGNANELAQLVFLNQDYYDKEKIENALKVYIDDANGSNILISSESLGAFEPKAGKYIYDFALQNGYQITVVYYVRAIADHEMSRYQQFVKENIFNGTFYDMLINKSDCSFLRTINNIIQTYGKENLIVKNYDMHKNNLIENFLTNILKIQNIDQFNIFKKSVNRSLTDYEMAMMKCFNKVLKTNEETIFISEAFINNFRDVNNKYKITRKELEVLEKRYTNLTKKINEYMSLEDVHLMLIDNLDIVDEITEPKLDEFQERIIVLISEIIKTVNIEKNNR